MRLPRLRTTLSVWFFLVAWSLFFGLSWTLDWFTWFTAFDQLVIMLFGVVVTVAEKWSREHRVLVIFAFGVLGLTGSVAAIVEGRRADADRRAMLDSLKTTAESLRDYATSQVESSNQLGSAIDQLSEVAAQSLESGEKTIALQDKLLSSVGTIHKDVREQGTSLTTTIKESIAQVDPSAVKTAEIKFSFYSPRESDFPVLTANATRTDGKVSVSIFAKNVSGTAAENVDLWVNICGECAYAKDPEHFVKVKGNIEQVRWRRVELMNPRTPGDLMDLELTVPERFNRAELGFRYSCKRCPPNAGSEWQYLIVLVEK